MCSVLAAGTRPVVNFSSSFDPQLNDGASCELILMNLCQPALGGASFFETRCVLLLRGRRLYAGVGGGESGVDGGSYVQQAQDAGTRSKPAPQTHQHRGHISFWSHSMGP